MAQGRIGRLRPPQHFFCWHPDWADVARDGPVGRIRPTGTGGDWLVRLSSWGGTSPTSGKTSDREAIIELVDGAAPSFTLSGWARDIDAWLWSRPTVQDVAVEGSRDDFAQLRAIVADGVK